MFFLFEDDEEMGDALETRGPSVDAAWECARAALECPF
jgi:hypothetical protein